MQKAITSFQTRIKQLKNITTTKNTITKNYKILRSKSNYRYARSFMKKNVNIYWKTFSKSLNKVIL